MDIEISVIRNDRMFESYSEIGQWNFISLQRVNDRLMKIDSGKSSYKCVTDEKYGENITCECSNVRLKSKFLGRMRGRSMNKYLSRMSTVIFAMWIFLQGGKSTSAAFTTGKYVFKIHLLSIGITF